MIQISFFETGIKTFYLLYKHTEKQNQRYT